LELPMMSAMRFSAEAQPALMAQPVRSNTKKTALRSARLIVPQPSIARSSYSESYHAIARILCDATHKVAVRTDAMSAMGSATSREMMARID
jgi:hypothetical protein